MVGMTDSGSGRGDPGESPLQRDLPHPLLSFLPTPSCGTHRTAASSQPASSPLPSLRPYAAETLGGKLWKPNSGRRVTWPARLRIPSPNRVTWQPQRGAQCVPPWRPRTASLWTVGDETSQAYYRKGRRWEQGGVRGWEQVPGAHLFSSRRVGTAGGWGRARLPGVRAAGRTMQHCVPPSPSPARPQSCAVGLTVPGAVPVLGPGAGET